jgi:beta-galactosidase
MPSTYPRSTPDWCNLKVIHRNVLPPRASFFNFKNAQNALSYDADASESLCLSGTWKFHYSNSPFEAPENFQSPDFDLSSWKDIRVPSMWQLEGYGKPHYSNVDYPFPVDPPYGMFFCLHQSMHQVTWLVPYDNNQTGSYTRNFVLPQNFAGNQIRLRFEGVDSSFHCWVNGTEVGYSQGARNPSEFDITSLIKEGENNLSVRVYQFCDGSYIEDQGKSPFKYGCERSH